MRDKEGNYLTLKEWLQRWRRDMEGITPLQQTNIQIQATLILIIGLLSGVVISIIGFKNLWWLMLILIAGLINTLVQLLGLWQKRTVLKRFENAN